MGIVEPTKGAAPAREAGKAWYYILRLCRGKESPGATQSPGLCPGVLYHSLVVFNYE